MSQIIHDEIASPRKSESKRKVRKGTFSCWQCKRRKVRCTFGSVSTNSCDGCRSRNVACVGQELPEGIHESSRLLPAKQCDPVTLAEQPHVELTTDAQTTDAGSKDESSIRPAIVTDRRDNLYSKSLFLHANPDYREVCRILLSLWPEEDEISIIASLKVNTSILFHGTVCSPYNKITSRKAESIREILQPPKNDVHPVLAAHRLLLLATLLQGIPADVTRGMETLSSTYQDIGARLTTAVYSLVLSRDDMVQSIEGIECIMIESMYLNNAGNLRQAWLRNRRAIMIAEMLGVSSGSLLKDVFLDQATRERVAPDCLWFRLVTTDRYLSLILALPQASRESPFASSEALQNCMPLERLERLESMAGGMIIERNRDQISELDLTMTIDAILHRAASCMSAQWWLTPTIDASQGFSDYSFETFVRTMNQFSHFYLVTQLHLPFALSASDTRGHDYSHNATLNACREILRRFLSFRSSHKLPVYCKGIDFLAFIASTVLCVAHIHAHRQHPYQLQHQRLTDRGIMESTLDFMEYMSTNDNDVVASKMAGRLRRILIFEAAAFGGDHVDVTVQFDDSPATDSDRKRDNTTTDSVTIHLPHLGTVSIHNMEGAILPDAIAGTMKSIGATADGAQMLQPPESLATEAGSCALDYSQIDISELFQFEQAMVTDPWDLQGVDLAVFDGLFPNLDS